MRMVVTGAHGFIGGEVSAELRRRGHRALTLALGPGRPGVAYDGRIPSLCARDELASRLAGWRPDAVLHIAGTTDMRHPADAFALNAGFSATLIEAMGLAGLRDTPLLLVGSAAEYGPLPGRMRPLDEAAPAEPAGAYGISKLAQTRLGLAAAAAGRPVVVARVFNVVGPGMPAHLSVSSFARRLAAAAAAGDPSLRAGNLDAVRDVVAVRSVAAALVDLATTPAAHGRVVNVCGGRPYRIGDLLDRMIRLAGLELAVEAGAADGTGSAARSAVAGASAGAADIAYGDPRLLTSLTGRALPALCDGDLAAVLREAGCPVHCADETEALPVVPSPAGSEP